MTIPLPMAVAPTTFGQIVSEAPEGAIPCMPSMFELPESAELADIPGVFDTELPEGLAVVPEADADPLEEFEPGMLDIAAGGFFGAGWAADDAAA